MLPQETTVVWKVSNTMELAEILAMASTSLMRVAGL
jgi:hypothetical protein